MLTVFYCIFVYIIYYPIYPVWGHRWSHLERLVVCKILPQGTPGISTPDKPWSPIG